MGKSKQGKQKHTQRAGARTASQVEAVVLGGNCLDVCPSILLSIGGDALLFNAGCGCDAISQQAQQLEPLALPPR